MSFGKMNTFIDIMEQRKTKDPEGFAATEGVVVASLRAYREGRHGSEKWTNRAAFSEATDLFRFRCIPGVKITTAMAIRCGDTRFNITSVEDVKGRGMYLEVLAKEATASGRSDGQAAGRVSEKTDPAGGTDGCHLHKDAGGWRGGGGDKNPG